jgi:transcriptional regulator with XRE-family HTH domain
MTQAQFAQLIGVSLATVQNWERIGKEQPEKELRVWQHRKLYPALAGGVAGVAGAAVGPLVAVGAVLGGPLGLFAGGLLAALAGSSLSSNVSAIEDTEVDVAAETIELLRRLSPSERVQFLELVTKMKGGSDNGES